MNEGKIRVMDLDEKVFDIIKDVKGRYFDERRNLITDGFISSFELIALILKLERSFDIKIPIERIEPESFNSVEQIAAFMSELIN